MTHLIRRLAVLVAVLLLIGAAAALSACRDEVPTAQPAEDQSATAETTEALIPGAESATPQSLEHQEQQQTALNYGVTEQRDQPQFKLYQATQSVDVGHSQAVSLTLTCSGQRGLSISGLRPARAERLAVMVFLLDNHPARTLDVSLQRYQSYGPDGSSEAATIQLDDADWYEALRGGERLTVHLLDSEQPPITFHLDLLFATIFQETFDGCDGAAVTDLTPAAPVEPAVTEQPQGPLVPGAVPAASDALAHQEGPRALLAYGVTEQPHVLATGPNHYAVYSVRNAVSGLFDISLLVNCSSEGRGLLILGLQPASHHDRGTLLFAVDDLPAQALAVPVQHVNHFGPDGQSETASIALEDPAWYELLRGHSELTVQLRGSEQAPVTFDLNQLFGTIFQETFDQCGNASVAEVSG